jgi:hypothetical protein
VKYLNPIHEPNKWLQAVLLDLLEQDTEESKEDLKAAIQALVSWMEPGLIDQLFADWAEQYLNLLDEQENNRGSDQALCSPAGSQE